MNAFFALFRHAVRADAESTVSFGVAMTTIPVRFSSIHNTIRSWLSQEFPPDVIVISIPKKYKRFKRKKNRSGNLESNRAAVLRNLKMEGIMVEKIVLIETSHDFGPATKFAGLLTVYSHNSFEISMPDYWIIGDDDVHYSSTTISRYYFALHSRLNPVSSAIESTGFTHFSKDIRIRLQLPDGRSKSIIHVQGVDTFMLSNRLLLQHNASDSALSYDSFKRLLDFFHSTCPESFYQDDYIISLAFSFASLKIVSLWNNDNVAKHVEGVSKSHSQMHMHKDVFMREEKTKDCVRQHAVSAYKLIENQRINPIASEL